MELHLRLETTLQNYLDSKNWILKAAILIISIAVFFGLILNSTQFIDRLNAFKLMAIFNYSQKQVIDANHYHVFWQFIKEQANNPLVQRHNYNVYMDHETNMVYRLFVPIVMRLTHLDIKGMLILQLFIGIAQLLATLQLAFMIFKDKLNAFYFTLAISTISFGQAYMLDFRGYCDSWAFAIMTFAIFFRHPGLIFIFTQMLFWVDERAIINTTFIGLWWVLNDKKFDHKTTWGNIFKNVRVYAILFSAIIYVVVRFSIENKYHLDMPNKWSVPINGTVSSIGPSLFKGSLGVFGGIFFSAFEGMILFTGLGLYLIYNKKDPIFTFLVFLSCTLTFVCSFMVYDSSRALAFSGIIFFVISPFLSEKLPNQKLKDFLRLIAFFNLVPVFFY